MRGTFICEAIVKTSMIPVPGQALELAPSATAGTGGMCLSPAPYEALWRDEEQPKTTPDVMAEPVKTRRTGFSPAGGGGAGGILWNPWPALERWWQRRRRIYWLPTSRNRPEITLEMVTSENWMAALTDWSVDYLEWNRARRFWRVAIMLASLSLAGIAANAVLERPPSGSTLSNTSIGEPTD